MLAGINAKRYCKLARNKDFVSKCSPLGLENCCHASTVDVLAKLADRRCERQLQDAAIALQAILI